MKNAWHLRCTIVACLMVGTGIPSFAADNHTRELYLNTATVATNIAGVQTFAEPPSNFDPVNASDEDLAQYGFPARPDVQAEPDHYAAWKRAMLAAKKRWHGELKSIPTMKQPSESPLANLMMEKTSSDVVTPGPVTATSFNWSGVVLTKNLTKYNPKNSFRDIYSFFTVATGELPFGATCDLYNQMTWIGLDGYVKNYAIQPANYLYSLLGGLYSSWDCTTGRPYYNAFFGWDPTLFQSAFAVNAGDIVYAEVGAPPNGNQPSYLFLEDLTTLTYQSFSVQLPYGETFIGNTAEWIVERHCCRNDGYPYPLLNTIDTFFDGGAALDYAGNTLYPGSQATTTQVLTMRDDDNDENIELIYQGSSGYEGQHGLLLQTTGCAYTGGCTEK
jgi:hypothetical protein